MMDMSINAILIGEAKLIVIGNANKIKIQTPIPKNKQAALNHCSFFLFPFRLYKNLNSKYMTKMISAV